MGRALGTVMSQDYQLEIFGDEREPLVVIDGFVEDLAALRAQAVSASFAVTSPHYPGIRAQANAAYLAERMDLLQDIVASVFGMSDGAKLVECAFSIVTAPRQSLTPIQCLPHFDSTDPGRLALLHYLSGSETGGTAFYRHVSSGYETITQDRLANYTKNLNAETATQTPTLAYYRSGALFECIGEIEARPNRMVLYRGYRLHSGIIPDALPLHADPATGRLTVNTFLQAR